MPDPDIFRQYLLLGGMPYLGNLSFEEKPSRQYLQDVFSSVVLKDIMMRNTVRDVDLLQRIIAYVFGNIGTIFSANSLSNYFKSENRTAAKETILNYLKYCEDAFLLYRVSRQDLMGKKILAVNEKYYVADHGLREAVYGGNMRDINLTLENMVIDASQASAPCQYAISNNCGTVQFIGNTSIKAYKNQTAFVRDLLEKLFQGIKTPMDVAYGISFHIRVYK